MEGHLWRTPEKDTRLVHTLVLDAKITEVHTFASTTGWKIQYLCVRVWGPSGGILQSPGVADPLTHPTFDQKPKMFRVPVFLSAVLDRKTKQ